MATPLDGLNEEERCALMKTWSNDDWEKFSTGSVPLTEVNTVEHPKHYTFGKFEVIEVLEDWFPTDPLLWQVGKYIARASHKGKQIEDLKKAKWYLERRIENLEFEASNQ